jgi:hypothetical protein
MRRIREGKIDRKIERELGDLDYDTLMAIDDGIVGVMKTLKQSASYAETAYGKLKKTAGVRDTEHLEALLDELNAIVEDSYSALGSLEEYHDAINYYLEDAYEFQSQYQDMRDR